MKRESGLTTIELVITLMLTSIFILLIGFIVVSANEWWIKASRNVTLQDNMRYARRRTSWLLSNATRDPLDVSGGKSLTFNGNEQIKLENTAGGQKQLVYINSGGGKEIILTGVDDLDIYDAGWLKAKGYEIKPWNSNEKSVVMFSVSASMPSTNGPNSGRITSSAEWIIKNRNSGS